MAQYILILNNQLFDYKYYTKIDKKCTYIVYEHPYFFKKFKKTHKLKIAYHRAAMRYYFDHLPVKRKIYVNFNDDFNSVLKRPKLSAGIMFNPIEKDLIKQFKKLKFLDSPYFLNSSAVKMKNIRHDTFYKMQRRKYNILLHNNMPLFGQWSFDKENRMKFPGPIKEEIKIINNRYTKEAIKYVDKYFKTNYGEINFIYPMTRKASLKWLSDFISQFQGRAYFLKGNEKMSYNLENLVDATSNRVIGQEKNITFSVNQAKSFGTKRLNSINEIKKNSNKLISKQEMNLIDEKNSDNFSMLSQSLKYEDENTWRKLDSLGKALADYFKGTSIVSALRKNDFKTPSSYQITLFEDFADELKNSPVDYFEAKYQRAVSLKEFKYAVVPKKTSKEVIQILIDNGITIKKYENEEQRLQIINTISNKDKSIKFEYGGRTL